MTVYLSLRFIDPQKKGGKMTGAPADRTKICPSCGGLLKDGNATIPFVINSDTIIVVKNVPAETCLDCHESFVGGKATDQVLELLKQLKSLKSEVSVVTYSPKQYALS